VFLDERKVGNLEDQLVLLGFGKHPPQRSQRVVAVRGRSGKLQLLDLVFRDLCGFLPGRSLPLIAAASLRAAAFCALVSLVSLVDPR